MWTAAKNELKPITRLAIPLVAAFLGYQLMGLVDTFVSGQLGVETLAATSLANALFWVITIFPMGVLMGLDPIIAQALGAQKKKQAWQACKDGLGLALVFGILTIPILFYFSAQGWPWSPKGAVSEQLLAYMYGRIYCVPLLMIHTCVRCFLQAHERGSIILIGTGISNVLNLFLSVYLGGGDALLTQLKLPSLGYIEHGLGAYGIGLASSIVLCAEVSLLCFQAYKIGQSPESSSVSSVENTQALESTEAVMTLKQRWKQLIRIGAPVGGSMLSEGGVFSSSTLIVSAWAPIVVGAHQVTLQIASMTFIISLGIANATTVRVGHAVGSGDWQRARGAGVVGMLFSLAMMSCSALGFLVFGEDIAGLITMDQQVIHLAGELLMIAAAFQLFDGLQVTAAAALRGAGLTKIPLYSAIISHWGVGLPLALLMAFYVGLEVHGLWWGLCGGLCTAAFILCYQFFSVTHQALQQDLTENSVPK